MSETKRIRVLTLVQTLVAVAIVAVLSAILFPVFRKVDKGASSSNLKKIARAAIQYGDDYDERIPLVANGAFRNLKNTKDGMLTSYGDQRTDLWPLIIVPYVKERSVYVDPTRQDTHRIFSGAALATQDTGYDVYGATYRNQNRFPFFGMNYLFLSPLSISDSSMSDAIPTDHMAAEVRRFFQADDPIRTVFFAPTFHGRMPQTVDDQVGKPDLTRGFFALNAPGLWTVLAASDSPYVVQWAGTRCSGDWCGQDIDPYTPGVQTSEAFFYQNSAGAGNNVAYLDGHVSFAKTLDLAAGTNYHSASPRDGGTGAYGGGAVITDKSKYIWNLDDFYFGS